ncbi:MAG: ABC transporter substrate-binding protein [Burkholderiales bacterium]
MQRRPALRAAAAVATALALAAPIEGPSVSAAAQQLTPVTVRLAFNYNGHRSPYLLGRDKGFYAAEGLDVQVLEGKGVTSSMQLVASKQDTFAIVDPPSLMLGVAQGMPVRTVVQLYQTSPNAVISWTSADVKKPADLVGKTVATLQGDTTTTMLLALLARNGIDASKVRIVASDGGTRNQTFLGKRADVITGFLNDSYLGLKSTADAPLAVFPYSDFGIDTMGDGVIAHIDTIKSNPKLVAGFVKATLRAYAYALDNPEEAIASLVKVAPNVKPQVEVDKLKATRGLLDSADTKKYGVGYSSKDKWIAAQALMAQYGGLAKTVDDVSTYYTNEFLPR